MIFNVIKMYSYFSRFSRGIKAIIISVRGYTVPVSRYTKRYKSVFLLTEAAASAVFKSGVTLIYWSLAYYKPCDPGVYRIKGLRVNRPNTPQGASPETIRLKLFLTVKLAQMFGIPVYAKNPSLENRALSGLGTYPSRARIVKNRDIYKKLTGSGIAPVSNLCSLGCPRFKWLECAKETQVLGWWYLIRTRPNSIDF